MENFAGLFNYFSKNWLLISFLAPALWALVNVTDAYLVKGVYRDEFDGVVISGLFQLIPIIFLCLFFAINYEKFVFSDFTIQSIGGYSVLALSLIGGVLYNISMFFYYKALFNHGDVALLQLLWSFTIIAVPVLAFIFWREKLPSLSYLGIGITFLGGVILSFNKRIKSKLSFGYLLIISSAIFFLSLSMVFQDKVYEIMEATIWGNTGFLIGFFIYSVGALASSLFFMAIFKKKPLALLKKYFLAFFILEGIVLIGNFFSQRAISISPSVSYVAMIETFVPFFVMVFSLFLLFYFHFFSKQNIKFKKDIYSEQIDGFWIKAIATIIMSAGVYIIS